MKLSRKPLLMSLTLVILLTVPYVVYSRMSYRFQTITVTDTMAIDQFGGTIKYIVIAEEGTFQVSNSIVFWNFEKEMDFREVKPGKIYNVEVYGWEIPALKMYRTIFTVDENIAETLRRSGWTNN